MKQDKESSFSEEKEAKRLLSIGYCSTGFTRTPRTKVFCFFFSKKKNLSSLRVHP
jgi:hypothetical protein